MSLTCFRGTDIFIVTYAKSGTTWTQAILYNIYKDMYGEIEHIGDVMPTLNRPDYGNNGLLAMSTLPIRIYKTHVKLSTVPNFCKRIYVMRNPIDVVKSYHGHHMLGNPMDFEVFRDLELAKKDDSWISHLEDALRCKGDPKALFISYDNLSNQFDKTLDSIISFLELEVSEEKKKEIREKTDFSYIKTVSDKFAPKMTRGKTKEFFRKGQDNAYVYETLDESLKPLWPWYEKYPYFLKEFGLSI